MADFLLELLSEEIPARMQAKASNDLAERLRDRLGDVGFHGLDVKHFVTPRRLAVIVRDLPPETPSGVTEIKGPRTTAPQQAFDGFLRSTGLAKEQLEDRGGVWFAVVEKPGRATGEVLAEIIPELIRAFPWPKSMRWGEASISTESQRWVRPLQGIVALLDDRIVDFEIAGLRSGAATVGHRFHHPGPITIGGAGDYAQKLRACHVIVDPEERKQLIRDGAARAAAEAGLALVEDEGLVAENAGLTEWPLPLLGSFDPAFLEVPREVIQLTMRTNQKYFALTGADGALAPAFVCTANILASDGGAAIVEGNRKVLAARLADAKFFWEHDLRVPLEAQAEKLGQIVFHEKLGTVADKVERVAKLARWLVEEGIVKPPPGESVEELASFVETSARICKSDLVSGLVGEFPELQGVIGGHLALCQGHARAISDAIRDHYKPVGQGDDVPTAPVTVAVSLADKLDTIAAFFAIAEAPTGSRDPFALRRAAISVLSLVQATGIRLRVLTVFRRAVALVVNSVMARTAAADHNYALYLATIKEVAPDRNLPKDEFDRRMEQMRVALGEFEIVMKPETQKVFTFLQSGGAIIRETPKSVLDFFADRLKVQQREAGVRHDLIDAVFALGGEDDLVRLLARVKALQGFVETREGADLLAGYKRAANILKKEGWPQISSPLVGEDARGADVPRTSAALSGGQGDLAHGGGPAASAAEETLPTSLEQSLSAADAAGPHPSPSPQGGGGLSYTPEKEETALLAALDSAEPRAIAAVEAEDFEGAMAALASLRAPVDAFFEKVTVNDPDEAKRAARLNLLARMRDAVHRVADFSRIEG